MNIPILKDILSADDKIIHFLLGNVAFFTFAEMFGEMYWAFLALVILAWGIEFVQKITNMGVYDNKDAIMMLLGAAFPTVVLSVF